MWVKALNVGEATRRRRHVVAVLLAVLVLLASCTTTSTTVAVNLEPSVLNWSRHYHHEYISSCFYSTGLGFPIEDFGPGETGIGYTNYYDWGVFCGEQFNQWARTYLRFDLSPITSLSSKLIISSRLHISELVVLSEDSEGNGKAITGDTTCVRPAWIEPDAIPANYDEVLAATGDFAPAHTGGDFWDVTSLASGWVTGSVPNTGLILRGVSESAVETNSSCVSKLSNIFLSIKYTTFGFKLPISTIPLEKTDTPTATKKPTKTKTPTKIPTKTKAPTKTPTKTPGFG